MQVAQAAAAVRLPPHFCTRADDPFPAAVSVALQKHPLGLTMHTLPTADNLNGRAPPVAGPPGGGAGSSLPSKALVLGAALAAGGLFGLFQLRLLPKAWGPWVSKLYFWPTLPFTMIRAFDNYWTQMDGEPRNKTNAVPCWCFIVVRL